MRRAAAARRPAQPRDARRRAGARDAGDRRRPRRARRGPRHRSPSGSGWTEPDRPRRRGRRRSPRCSARPARTTRRAGARARCCSWPSWRPPCPRCTSRRRCGRRPRRSLLLTPRHEHPCAHCSAPCLLLAVLAAPAARAGRGADPHLRVRPGPDRARPEHDRDRGEPAQAARPTAGSRASSRTSSTPRTAAVPRVDVIHLHHGVWLTEDPSNELGFSPLFAAGRGEDGDHRAARLRLALRRRRPAGS